ncbi:major facilitator family protein [Psychromonas sp. CNPT3]|uniref:MFS transporter n=1 Tax=Psychromonas sp. CNPT3 TaxID=314282 RepID=UPI00006E8952|nr:MFS transporter [Psychromonas sp. CNPT3]AGH81017.1 major facilitator family protein [Psychromonas sp. CNPT3]
MNKIISPSHRLLIIFCIVFAGEIIFSLPFHVARFFRPTLLDAFSLTNTQLGDVFGLYGVMAMLAYFPGGAIADRFSGRDLMCFSLFATALGGLYFVQIPDINGLALLYGYWGITTILLFWAPMIKVTRQWGGETSQGKAFGVLDGGRGLVAAGVASVAVFLLSKAMPINTEVMTRANQIDGLTSVIIFYSVLTFLAAILLRAVIPSDISSTSDTIQEITKDRKFDIVAGVKQTLKDPNVWLQSFIVLAAYCTYKSIDYFGLYATNVLGMSDIESASLVTNASYIRPIAALLAGVLADKLRADRVISWGFVLLTLCYLCFAFFNNDSANYLLEINITLTFLLVFAIRGVYFALLAESKLAGRVTGTAVGIISVIGFTPDIFFAPVAGRILDASPGAQGFHNLFILMAVIAASGWLFAQLILRQRLKKERLVSSDT